MKSCQLQRSQEIFLYITNRGIYRSTLQTDRHETAMLFLIATLLAHYYKEKRISLPECRKSDIDAGNVR